MYPLDEPHKRKLAALNANLTLSDITFQEIRDYQKQLHKALKLRRKNFHEKILVENKYSEKKYDYDNKNNNTYETVDSLLLKGLTAHNRENYQEAVDIYSEILKRDIKKNIMTIIHVHRGMAYYSSGQTDKALHDFNKALELEPGNTTARYYRALHSRISRRYDDAISDLEKCIEKEPFNMEYLTAKDQITGFSSDPSSASFLQPVIIRTGISITRTISIVIFFIYFSFFTIYKNYILILLL